MILDLKRFPAQVEKVGKIEWGGSANDDIDSDVTTDGGVEVDGKDVVEKKKFWKYFEVVWQERR